MEITQITQFLFNNNEETEQEFLKKPSLMGCNAMFKKGDSVYRCWDCGLDDTCVMCKDCFNATDHTGHKYSFAISGGSGGCCDCGDTEAWRIPLNCRLHPTEHAESPSINLISPPSLKSVEERLSAVLDMIIIVLGNWYMRTGNNPMEIVNAASLPSDEEEFLETFPEDRLYSVVLWNDESHSFQDVIECVSEAIGCSEEHANDIAVQVDTFVRAPLKMIYNHS